MTPDLLCSNYVPHVTCFCVLVLVLTLCGISGWLLRPPPYNIVHAGDSSSIDLDDTDFRYWKHPHIFLPSCTDEIMEMENYFLITPRSHRCEIMLKAEAYK